ncbi:MAG: AMP-binding protein [Desulfobacterota bacterium]|jgi:long-chain acyl-CoA synthetase|nr:AMP-binding protein [Thermodesulfobacteriota bacterium]
MRTNTLPHLFLDKVNRFGDRVALREKRLGVWKEISWHEYCRHVRHFCLGLIDLGLERGQHIAILGENVPQWLYADLAVQSAGGMGVGVYSTNPPAEARHVIGHSDSVFAVCGDQEQVDKVLEVKNQLPLLKRIIAIDMKGMRNYRDPLLISFAAVEALGEKADEHDPGRFCSLVERVEPHDTAILVYTPGTTGPPKGAMISHYNVLRMVQALNAVIPQDENDEIVSYLPLCHVAERIASVFVPLWSGSTVNFAEGIDTVTRDLKEIQPTFFFAVPRIWGKMMSGVLAKMKNATWLKRMAFDVFLPVGRKAAETRLAGKTLPPSLRLLNFVGHLCLFRPLRKDLGLLRSHLALSAAAPISVDVLRFFHTLGVQVLEAWGQTEGSGVATITLPGRMKLGTVGPAVPGVDIRLAEDGEILVRCEHIFQGYYKDPETTARTIEDGWLYTGDVGELDKDGVLKIIDRKKEIIITSGGKNISPSEIENRLKCSPYINEAVVVGDRRKYLTALIQIDYDNVAKWAQEQGLAYTTFKSLSQLPEVRELIQKEVDEGNKDFSQVETIKKFRLLNKSLDHDDGEVTATLRLRRKEINRKFASIIEEMYASS